MTQDSPSTRPPNVVLVVLDDAGFAQLGCFGAELSTPRIDAIATTGLRFNSFHVTALCSPTRSCLLSGRNHHSVGIGLFPEIPINRPGYSGRLPDDLATLPGTLRSAGYTTYAVGKWHLTPKWERSAAGPFARWPLGMGFDRYYGFLGAESNQWSPTLVRDNGVIPAPQNVGDGYHLTEDLADQAVLMIRDHVQAVPQRPFFMYFATAAPHAPHHVGSQWSDRYRGEFDSGWEAMRERVFRRQLNEGVVPEGTTLTPRPSWVPAWDSLSDAERVAFARSQEVFAGLVTHTDAQIGRIVDALTEQGVHDNTVIMVMSDNGASAEGGPTGTFNEYALTLGGDDSIIDRVDELGTNRGYQHYPWGWAWAGNTPFKLWKRYTWLGGTRTPLVVGWPAGIRDGGAIRQQFCHAVDVMPTILDVAGVQPSDGLDGRSFRPSFDDPAATTRPTQYFEILGSRAIYHDGWKATTDHVISGVGAETELLEGSHRYEDDRWSLYDLRTDFSESHDQAGSESERLDQMIDLWTTEAERNQVLPLNEDSFLDLIRDAAANAPGRRERHTYRIGTSPVHEDVCPDLASGFVLTAEIDTDAESATGILCARGRLEQRVGRLYRRRAPALRPVAGRSANHRLVAATPRTPLDGGDPIRARRRQPARHGHAHRQR